MNFLRIQAAGGYISPDKLQQLAVLSKKYALGKIEIGFRQDLLVNSTSKQLSELRNQLGINGFQVEEANATHPNVVSSMVARNIFPKTSWLRSGDYLDILNIGEAIARLEKPFLDIGGGHERATLSAYTKFYNELLASDEIPTE